MNRFRNIVQAAMESQEGDAPDAFDASLSAPAIDVTASDAAVADAAAGHREVEAAYSDSDTLVEVAGGLEALLASLEALDKPLEPNAAVFMNIAAESHMSRVGLDMADAPMIVSFESEEGAAKATGLSVATVKTKLKAIWEAIKRMFVKVRDAIMTFFKNLISANHHLQQRAEALLASAAKATGEAREAEVAIGMTKLKLHVDGKLDNAMHDLANVVFLVEDMNHNPGADIAMSAKLTLEILLAKDEAGIDAAIEKFKTVEFKAPRVFSEKVEEDGQTVHFTKELPGGVQMGVAVGKTGEAKDGLEHLKNVVKSVNRHNKKHFDFNAESKAKTLSLADIKQIGQAGIVVAKQGEAFKAQVDKVFAEIEALGKNNAEAKAEQIGATGAKKIGDAYHALAIFGQKYARCPIFAAQYSTTTLRAYITYAEKSLAQYGEPAKADAAPAEVSKENFEDTISEESATSTVYGLAVGAAGAFLGPIWNACVSGMYGPMAVKYSNDIKALEKKISALEAELEKEIPKALNESKLKEELSAKDLAKYTASVIGGAVGGFFLGGIATGVLGAEIVSKGETMQKLRKEMLDKSTELNALIRVQQRENLKLAKK